MENIHKNIRKLFLLSVILSLLGIIGGGVVAVLFYLFRSETTIPAWIAYQYIVIYSTAYTMVIALLFLQIRKLNGLRKYVDN